LKDGLCLDPETSTIAGATSLQVKKSIGIAFVPCIGDPNRTVICWEYPSTIESWTERNLADASVEIFYSSSFIDFAEIEKPFKREIRSALFKDLVSENATKMTSQLMMHELELKDNLIVPFYGEGGGTKYLTLDPY
jgi:hypothetical protein